jgi:signal transduction histidine kinase
MAYKEMLHNISAHAHATTVRIELEHSGGQLTLRVTDDGVGFSPETVAKGNGLQTMRQRAEQMKGSLHVDTAPGRGTRIELTTRIP